MKYAYSSLCSIYQYIIFFTDDSNSIKFEAVLFFFIVQTYTGGSMWLSTSIQHCLKCHIMTCWEKGLSKENWPFKISEFWILHHSCAMIENNVARKLTLCFSTKVLSPLLMVSRCSHRISPAVESDSRPRKASWSRPHSSLPSRPLRSEPRQQSPNSAWHQSSQWFTSHFDHNLGSKYTCTCINNRVGNTWQLIKAPTPTVPCGKWQLILSWVKPAKLAFTAWVKTSLLVGVRGGTSRTSNSGTKVMFTLYNTLKTTYHWIFHNFWFSYFIHGAIKLIYRD